MTRLAEQGRLGDTLAGLGKFHNTTRARAVLAEARDLLGGNGILLDYQVIKHMVDLEAIHTFEGTETIQALIVGRDITGASAHSPNSSDRARPQRPRQNAGCPGYRQHFQFQSRWPCLTNRPPQ